jgi:acyl-CoA thioester hydrolase
MSRGDVPETRDDYAWYTTITTRWMDNDVYGHVNNVVYYSFFDTVIAEFLRGEGGFNFETSAVIGLAVDSGCRYRRAIAFPQSVHAGLRIAHLGNTSVRYEVGIFADDENEASAEGHFVHVFVTRETNVPTPIPSGIRAAMERVNVG